METFAPNPLGLYDTAGNAMEWVEDCYHSNYKGAPEQAIPWESGDCHYRVARGGAFCPFCPENVLKVTPCFPPEIVPEGRMTRGDMVLFPNLAPYDSLGAVATLGSEHFIPMTAIEPERIVNGFSLAMDFFRRVQDLNHPEAVYHIINWNYMPASGSSLIHTHLQVFSTSSAPGRWKPTPVTSTFATSIPRSGKS